MPIRFRSYAEKDLCIRCSQRLVDITEGVSFQVWIVSENKQDGDHDEKA